MTTAINNLSDRFSGSSKASPSNEPSPLAVQRDSVVKNEEALSQKAESLRPVQEIDPTDRNQVEEVLKTLVSEVSQIQKGLNFSVDEQNGEFVIRVIDQSTDEVIRQIPSEEMLNIINRLNEVNSLLFDDIKA